MERESDGRRFVVKQLMISVDELASKVGFADEVKVMSRFRHPRIVQLYDSYIEGEVLYILMEYAADGSLYSKIQDAAMKKEHFDEPQILRWFVQIALALKHVHDHKILHRDVTAKNVFLTSDGHVKLGDFGISKQLSTQTNLAQTVIGTPNYLSPEIWQGRAYDAKSDVWSLGCILCEMASLSPAFRQPDLPSMMHAITNASYTTVPEGYSDVIKALVASILRPNPEDRPTLGQLMKAPVLQKYIIMHAEEFGSTEEGTSGALEMDGPSPAPPPAKGGKMLRRGSADSGAGGGPRPPPKPTDGNTFIRKVR